jgi:hypothetical protein
MIIASQIPVLSQGFDWQYSARLPFDAPHYYIGISARYGLNWTTGNISFLENKLRCPDFYDATGNGFNIGIATQYWLDDSRYALHANLYYSNHSLNASIIDRVPLTSTLTAEYETNLNLSFSQLNLLIGGKYRIPSTHLNIGADIGIAYNINRTFDVTETILGPIEVPPFQTNPPSYSRDVINGELNQMHALYINPNINISYDIPLGIGTYIEPMLSLNIPLYSIMNGDNVHNYSIQFAINILRGIK